MATSKSNAKKLARTVLALSTAGTKYQFLTRPGMNNWVSAIGLKVDQVKSKLEPRG